MQKRVYGHKKQGAKFGHAKIGGKSVLVRGLNALAATVCTPLCAPVIAATRLRGGNAASARGAASFAARALAAARACGCTGTIVVRLDSGFYSAAVLAAVGRAGACFPVTVPLHAKVQAVIAAVPQDAWTPIRYPRAVWDDQLGAWVSDAEVAETTCTAFAHDKDRAVTARLIVRRIRDLSKEAAAGQGRAVPRLPLPRRADRLAVRAGPHPDTRQGSPAQDPRSRNHGQAAEHASGSKNTPENSPQRRATGNAELGIQPVDRG
jgi:hypothetical protein